MKKRLLAGILALLLLLLTACTGGRGKTVSKTAIKLDTVVTITLYGWEDPAAIDAAFNEIDRLAALLDVNVEGSDAARLSAAAGEWVEIAPETAELLALANEYYELSGGYFDVTASPLVQLWNISGGYLPMQAEIEAAKALTNGAALLLEGGAACLEERGMSIDLGGIAKGYIADKVKALLISLGVEHAVIDLGGNILLIGGKTDGSAFKIGIKDPFGENGEILATVESCGESLVTSGIYERYFECEGKRYHHIIDPFTGAPSESDLAGVTVIGAESVRCDALSTVCLLRGSSAALELMENYEGYRALLVTRSGEILTTSDWEY